MKISDEIRQEIEFDLGLNLNYVKGCTISIRNCWHFSTDGNLVDYLFGDEEDFVVGVNRLYILSMKYKIVILAYALMDTHAHFILWGELEECKRFTHEFIRLYSMHISRKYGTMHKLCNVHPSVQTIDNDIYLKTAICYVLKNPPVGGIHFNAWDYPWSSASLYFRKDKYWTSCDWNSQAIDSSSLSTVSIRQILHSKAKLKQSVKLIGNMVCPEEFVAVDIVEKIFRTHKGFNYFMCTSKESDVESVHGTISRLSIPYSELREHKIEICRERFGTDSIRSLTTGQRLIVARILKSKFNSSPKQIAKSCGLIYEEVKSML